MLRHERMTVAMALAEHLHHSRQKVEGGELEGPRAQKTVRVTGARLEVLMDPEPRSVTWLPRCLSVASLAGGDEVDATTTMCLLKCALRKRQEEEEREEGR